MKVEGCAYCGDKHEFPYGKLVTELPMSDIYLFSEQSCPGRCIVACNKHVNDITDLTDDERNAFFADVVKVSKAIQEIFHPDKVNYGANTRGVQVASEYYFDKDAKDLNLVEAAMLAGIINAPNLNNPYYEPLNCQRRTATVLYQMYNHGYITEMEYQQCLQSAGR